MRRIFFPLSPGLSTALKSAGAGRSGGTGRGQRSAAGKRAARAAGKGAVAASRELLQWTTVAPLRFLGRISYSLYLVHWPIFYVCALLAVVCRPILPTHIWGNLVVMVTSVIIAVGLAALSYRFVEAPSIRAGKSVAHALERVLAWTWTSIRRPQAEVG